MNQILKNHEKFLLESMEDPETDLSQLAHYHATWIGFMQHERLIHLMVTLAVALLLFISLGLSLFSNSVYFLILVAILLILLLFYIIHYYKLENGVQRWYALYDEIMAKLG